jgi:hypothetical protein
MRFLVQPHSLALRILLVILISVSLLDFGCQEEGGTTWSTEVRSPDGLWLASARSRQWGGPGTAYDDTEVYLKQIDLSQPAKQVLQFSHNFATMNLKLVWVSPKHLDVMYGPSERPGDHVKLDFRIAQYNGIEVSVQDVSTHAGRVAESAGAH